MASKRALIDLNVKIRSRLQTLMLQMLGAFSEFERTLIKERQQEGIEAANAQGKKLGAPAILSAEQTAETKTFSQPEKGT